MHRHPVFFDPHGRRRRRTRVVFAFGGVALAIAGTLFILSLLAIPLLPRIPGFTAQPRHGRLSALRWPSAREQKAEMLLAKDRSRLLQDIAQRKAHSRPVKSTAGPVVAAFLAPWQDAGLQSLKENASRLTHLFPVWLHLGEDGLSIDFRDWDPDRNIDNPETVRIARRAGLTVMPIFGNDGDSGFDAKRVALLESDPAHRDDLIAQVVAWLSDNRFDGLSLDFENLSPTVEAKYPGLVKSFADALHARHMMLSVNLAVDCDDQTLAAIGKVADFVVPMAYDQHYASGQPGPIASIDFTEQVVDRFASLVPRSKLILGIGNYAYDWSSSGGEAETDSYQGALTKAQGYCDDMAPEKAVVLDPDSLNTTFRYADEKDRQHVVWLLDGVSAYNQTDVARDAGLRGTALWVLGTEDPTVWTFLDRHSSGQPQQSDRLQKVRFPFEVDFQGSGEILSVRATPHEGQRTVKEDPDSGLIVSSVYHCYPSSYVVAKSGKQANQLAITFDDGPDPAYTGPILDYLKSEQVPATFFVIGESAERYPDLLRREVDEGHEVGSHTFTHPNLGTASPEQTVLELNATQRAIQSITGRSTILFRPPYNADSEPRSGQEVRPIALAAKLGYLTIGESIDPQDWNLVAEGKRRTSKDIVDSVREQLRTGNVLLFHDGGGDRSATLDALKVLIPELRQEGYQFVPVSALAGIPRDTAMPPLTDKDLALIGYDKVVFWFVFVLESVLRVGFLAAIILGFLRLATILPLALLFQRRTKRLAFDPSFQPPVSALIAAYNEERVVVGTIRSILANDYPVREVVVIDDGSTDGTSNAVETAFAGDPRVRLVCQENGGKAAALNHGLSLATGEILFCVDADTQLSPDAVGLLVRHFHDPKVAAVAGNVKVGNRRNLLTQWQSVEYITSQNLDRQAYALLNSVTVVPGAIGAWRKTAVAEAGGYQSDTLAEDMDLTWRIRRAGWMITTETGAKAYTEAPDTLRAFFRQRFRWAFGSLQCLWKHRRALGRYGAFGRFALPSMWVFQIAFQALAPLADLTLLYTFGAFAVSAVHAQVLHGDWQPLAAAFVQLRVVAALYVLFFIAELLSGLFAFRLDREKPGVLWSLLIQRFVYRQIMYGVVYRSFAVALAGARQGWGKLERKATVKMN